MSAVVTVSAAVLLVSSSASPAAVAGPSPASGPTSTSTTDVQVKNLLARVHALQAQVAAAESRYNAAFNAVADSVNASITADQQDSAILSEQQAARDQLDQRVQGLYESGGPIAEYATILIKGNISDFANQTMIATRVVAAQVASLHAATAAADQAGTVAVDASAREHQQIGTERSVAAAANRVSSLLAEQSALLAEAKARLAADRATTAQLAAIAAAQQTMGSESSSFTGITQTDIANLRVLPPPASYLTLYRSAAQTCPGLPWTVLAAIGQVESGHGRNSAVSSAGAQGPMQFEPATFAAYAVDGDHDGVASIDSPADSIYTAAHYLCANGAGRSSTALDDAILHYNHAVWYVEMVLKLSGEYAAAYA